MRLSSKCLSATIILSVFLLPTFSLATLTDLQWRVHEGDEIRYTYRGRTSVGSLYGNISIDEEIYFVVDDLTGVPVPGISGVFAGGAPSVSVYWANRTAFDAEGWFSNIHIVDAIAVRVGNWSLYTDLTKQFIDSLNDQYRDLWSDPTFDRFEVVLHEKSKVWNVTVFVSVYNGTGGQLTGISSFEYSKADGVLNSGYYIDEPESELHCQYLSIVRIEDQTNLPFEVVIGGIAIAAIGVIIVILVKQRN